MTVTDRPTRPARPGPASPPPASHRRLILATAAVVVLALFLTWLIGFSSVLGVGTIDVRGNHRVSRAEIVRAAAVEDGTPLVRLDTGAVRHRVLQLADIATVSVQTSFPSTVTITVSERIAIGYLRTVTGSAATFQLVDRTGDAYRDASAKPAGLPRLAVPDAAPRTTLGGVATVAADLPVVLRKRVVSIQAMDTQGITLVLHDGRVVRWGSTDDSREKGRILGPLLRQPGSVFDLSNPTQPVVRSD